MLNSAIYQGFVRRLVPPLLPCVALYPRISWMESWMKPASRLGAPAKTCVLTRPGVRHLQVHAPRIDGQLVGTMRAWCARWISITGPANGSP